jgi:hydrogenase maturation protein HypF
LTVADTHTLPAEPPSRVRLSIRGAVQGVGFRPFVFRLAQDLALSGWVENTPDGLLIEIEGPEGVLRTFHRRLLAEGPSLASIDLAAVDHCPPEHAAGFVIRRSATGGTASATMLPDAATCPECLAETLDPANRRYRYPFTNCTACGPRFSIIESLPYDRPRTSMRRFPMCAACRREYEDPANRRFHAQPNACPDCGPSLSLRDAAGRCLGRRDEALVGAARAIDRGSVVAIKGLGGFHLVVDARNGAAIAELRRRKNREEKPLAVLFSDIDSVCRECHVTDIEAGLLTSVQAPIVLLRRKPAGGIAEDVAPGNPYLGAMLPCTPLHHLLMADLGYPVVATSGNRSEEPICIDDKEALKRLGGIADFFLVHDRPIVRHVDDSVVRVVAGREQVLRRARGYAPLPITLPEGEDDPGTVLAVGAHQKNTIALAVGDRAFISQHIGDLENTGALRAFREVIDCFEGVYRTTPGRVVCDAHPDYLSTDYAVRRGVDLQAVQHHYAHVLSCMAEHGLSAPLLGIAWDGTGYGLDGTVWGGEFLTILPEGFRRFAALAPFPLPGGDRASREPRRSALGMLYELDGAAAPEVHRELLAPLFTPAEVQALSQMLARRVNTPYTSSVGRLFDAVAALTGLRGRCSFEGQAAMELEFAAEGHAAGHGYDFGVIPNPARPGPGTPVESRAEHLIDWRPMLRGILSDLAHGETRGRIAARFHSTLAGIIAEVAALAGERQVVLTGGCFQNCLLTEGAIDALRAGGHEPHWHQRIPPNDGGISLGQIAATRRTR